MPQLKVYTPKFISRFLKKRPGETKAGEKIQFIARLEELSKSDAKYVIFGIPEDIGVRANYGKAGAASAWNAFLEAFLNIQHNDFLSSENLVLLGEINCSAEMEKASNLDFSDPNYYVKLGEMVEAIDEVVSAVVKAIISTGKIPIIIGGGHNNAFGNIKGASEAFGKPLNVLNIDAHTDLRKLEHRHSGNGFSYARNRKFLDKYAIFGLQENYTPQYIFKEMEVSAEVKYSLFGNLNNGDENAIFEKQLGFVSEGNFGLEVDCDAIAGFPSSAISPSGFTLDEVRNFIGMAGRRQNCSYLHLCEAIATKDYPTGKSLSFLVYEFVKNSNYA